MQSLSIAGHTVAVPAQPNTTVSVAAGSATLATITPPLSSSVIRDGGATG